LPSSGASATPDRCESVSVVTPAVPGIGENHPAPRMGHESVCKRLTLNKLSH
jgi:hypothetical protein